MEINNSKQTSRSNENIFSVSEYIDLVNRWLKEFSAKIIGEVGKVDIGPTGHIYFSLRDEKDQSIINCIIWKSKYRMYGVELKEGSKVVATGCPDIYKQTGRFSFIAETIELAGEGMLKKEYERLKKKLTDEGIFEEIRKRAIPKYPQKIGIITSRQGAVLGDFLSNIGKYGFKIKLIDSRVEGQAAVADLLSSIEAFKKQDIEVLVIMRGGGSFESLQAFNNELLVRKIVDFPVPVIAAIGHDKDMPLISLAADLEVSTPSIAAITLSESWRQAILFLERYERNVFSNYERALGNADNLISQALEGIREASNSIVGRYKEIEKELRISFQNFKNALLNIETGLKTFWSKYLFSFKGLLEASSQRLENIENIISANNPERQLKLGYSIAQCDGRIIRSVRNIKIGESIDIRIVDGTINSEVKNINKINKNG